jgi:hypothetical protein
VVPYSVAPARNRLFSVVSTGSIFWSNSRHSVYNSASTEIVEKI